jgi:hypothetical protein
MTNFDPIPAPEPLSTPLDPDGGLLCLWVYWRPNPDEPNPEMPGQKLSMTTYIPLRLRDACLCGSGKSYGACCRRRRYWHPICPNAGLKGYSLLAWQSATFTGVDGAAVRARLLDAVQLHCVEDSSRKGFWVYWGNPALESKYGTICFGDLDLQGDTLLVTVASDRRMRVLLGLLKEIAGDLLRRPQIRHDPVKMLDKQSGEYISIVPERSRWQGRPGR